MLPATKTPTPPLGPRSRILVVKLAGLGDLLLAVPAIRALRVRYPDARIDVLTSPAAAPLLADSPLVDHLYTLGATARRTSDALSPTIHGVAAMANVAVNVARLSAVRYDALLLLHHLTLPRGVRKHRTLLRLINARLTVGLDNGRGGFLDRRVADAGFGARHEAEYFSAVAAALGAPAAAQPAGPTLADLGWDDLSRATEKPREHRRVALHIGSGTYSVARRWPIERFAEFATALHRRHGVEVTLVGGTDEKALCGQMLELLGRPHWATRAEEGGTPRDLTRSLLACDLFVGNDSFPMHLATAAGLPVVAVFGPSNARAWGPYAPEALERVAIVRRDDLPCSPCFYRGYALGTPEGCPPRPCLTALEVQPVLAAAERLLRRAAFASRDG